MYLVRSLRTFIGTEEERTNAGLSAFLSGDEYIETDTSNIYIHDGMAWRLNSGGGSPGGSNTQIQFNDDGVFAGDAGLTYDKTTDILSVSSSLNNGGIALTNTNSPSFASATELIWYLNNSTLTSTQFGKFIFGNNGQTAGSENGIVDLQTKLSGTLRSRIFVKSTETAFNNDGQDVDFIIKGTGGVGAGTAGIMKVDAALGAVQFNVNTAGDLMDFRSTGIVFNEGGADIDIRFEGDTATNLVVIDAGLDAFQVGTATAGALLDIRPTSTVFNNAEADIDFRIAGNGVTNGIFYNAGTNRTGFNTATPLNTVHIKGSGSVLYLEGTNTGDLNSVGFGFYDSGGTRRGFIGDASTSDDDIYIIADTGNIKLYANGAVRATLYSGLVIGSPTGGDKGAGTINAQAVYDDNVLLSDHLWDLYYDGEMRPDDKKKHANAHIWSIDETLSFTQQNRHLPTLPSRDEWESNGASSVGQIITGLWQAVEILQMHIFELRGKRNQ